MNTPVNVSNLFSGVSMVPGVGYVASAGSGGSALGAPGQLGDDASVMMISGLGSEGRQVAVNEEGVVQKVTGAAYSLKAALSQPVKIGSVELPLWAWLLIAGGVIGAAGYFFLLRKK